MESYLKSFILCENIGKDMTGKPVFSGVFTSLKAITYPSAMTFYLVTEWFVGNGSFKEIIKVLTPQKDKLYYEIPPRNFTCEKQFTINKSILPLNSFPIHRPGFIWFQAWLNDKLYSEFPVVIETKISRIIGKRR